MKQIVLIAILFCALPLGAQQSFTASGTSFSFGIPEGPDRVAPGGESSKLVIYIVSPFSGSGTLEYINTAVPFSFTPNTPTILTLPNSLVITDQSFTNVSKGIRIRTSQPVSAVLHRLMEHAGDATQLYPDNMLGKEYIVSSWGLWNDDNEDNLTQFVVTATENETYVEITPSIRCQGGQPWMPIGFILGVGESVCVKADITSAAFEGGLSGSMIKATYPVSVVTNTTCAYVPLMTQACNEMLDMLLPTDRLGSHFIASPLANYPMQCSVIFVSPTKEFNVISGRGLSAETKNGRLDMPLTQPDVFSVSAPALCHIVTPGVELGATSDPSLVSVYPVELYSDTLLWYTPVMRASNVSFLHFATIIFPRDNAAETKLDGESLSILGTSTPIPQSTYDALQIQIGPGIHTVTSPSKVFVIASGFQTADAYTFAASGISAQRVSVGANTNEPKCELYPNPASNRLTVRCAEKVQVSLFDILGRIVLQTTSSEKETPLDITSLLPGHYIVRCTTSTEISQHIVHIVR